MTITAKEHASQRLDEMEVAAEILRLLINSLGLTGAYSSGPAIQTVYRLPEKHEDHTCVYILERLPSDLNSPVDDRMRKAAAAHMESCIRAQAPVYFYKGNPMAEKCGAIVMTQDGCGVTVTMMYKPAIDAWELTCMHASIQQQEPAGMAQ